MAAFGQVVSAISIHALLAESDRHILIPLRWMTSFLSTLSLRRATDRSWRKQSNHHKFLSTLSLRRATRIEPDQVPGYTISIHALLAESDPRFRFAPLPAAYFYPRSPCGERLLTAACIFLSMPFLSTLSLRRATYGTLIYSNGKAYFYPRSPCGERRPAHGCIGSADNISIHALLAESDVRAAHTRTLTLKFLSTLSLRRATLRQIDRKPNGKISIHALLAESDDGLRLPYHQGGNFYPRSPCGERLCIDLGVTGVTINFYPRSPCGERQM